ncbi:MAG TPA: hypothetical protein VH853_10115 [Polyangia bacterium]|nr:hypothetical protein [Polyangia bacterium]
MRNLKQTVRRARQVVVVAAALAAVLAGCDSPTTLEVTVEVADTSVPFFTQLTIKISSVADPTREISQMFITTAPGYGAEGGLPPVSLPQQDTFTLEPSYISGEVLVAVQGLDIVSGAVLATGSATAEVVAKQQAQVTVTLHGLGSGCPADGGVGADAAAGSCDAGAEARPGG